MHHNIFMMNYFNYCWKTRNPNHQRNSDVTTLTCLLLSHFYHQPKTHSECRAQRSPEGDVQSYYDTQFVTPLESRLCEKSFSRNAEQVCSPLISLLLGECRGVRTCVLDIGA